MSRPPRLFTTVGMAVATTVDSIAASTTESITPTVTRRVRTMVKPCAHDRPRPSASGVLVVVGPGAVPPSAPAVHVRSRAGGPLAADLPCGSPIIHVGGSGARTTFTIGDGQDPLAT